MGQLSSAAAAETCGCVRRAGDVSRLGNRTNLIDEICVLSLLAQLEVSSEQLSVLVLEFVAKSLNCVSIDECSGCFAFGMDCVGDFTSVLSIFKANRVNVAVGLAAASLEAIEAIFECVVGCVETITESIGDATELSVYILIVETFEEIRAGNGSLSGGVASTVSAATEDATIAKKSKPYEINKGVVHPSFVVIAVESGDVR